MAMSPRLCARKPLFHRHFRDLLRNHVASRCLFAQTSRPTTSYKFRTKEAQNARNSPKTAHFCSALPSIVICVAAQCRHAYSCNKIRRNPNSITSLQIAVFLRSLAWLAYLVASVLQSPHRAFLGLTRRYLRQKRRRLEWSLAALISSLNCDYHLATAPINSFVFVGVLDFYHPEFIVQVDFTDPPKLEGGVCHKPLCCRRCRRT